MSRNQRDVLIELLVLQAQGGDPQAFGSLAKLLQQELVAYSFRLVADSHAAKDVVQEAWVSVLKGIRRLQDPASFRAWVYRIVHNKSMDSLRTAVRYRDELETFRQTSEAKTSTAEPDPPRELDDLRTLIDTLPTTDRALLTLYYENGLSIREIASITGNSESAIKSKLFHLRQEMKQRLLSLKGKKNDT